MCSNHRVCVSHRRRRVSHGDRSLKIHDSSIFPKRNTLSDASEYQIERNTVLMAIASTSESDKKILEDMSCLNWSSHGSVDGSNKNTYSYNFGYRKIFSKNRKITRSCNSNRDPSTVILSLSNVADSIATIVHEYMARNRGRHRNQIASMYRTFDNPNEVHDIDTCNERLESERRAARPMVCKELISDFIMHFCEETFMEYEVMIVSLVYLERILQGRENEFFMNEYNYKGVLFACMMMANKIWDDFHISNGMHCDIFSGLTLSRVNALEIQLVTILNYKMHVSHVEYATCHYRVQDLITKSHLQSKRHHYRSSSNRTPSPLCLTELDKPVSISDNSALEVTADKDALIAKNWNIDIRNDEYSCGGRGLDIDGDVKVAEVEQGKEKIRSNKCSWRVLLTKFQSWLKQNSRIAPSLASVGCTEKSLSDNEEGNERSRTILDSETL
jgi:hypothetical protein